MSSETATGAVPASAAASDLDRLRIDRGRPGTRRRALGWLVWPLLVVVVAGGVLWTMADALFAPEVRTAVVVRAAATADVVRTTASGYVVARRKAAISSRLAGRLETLLVDVGDRVEEGQLLGQLGHDDLAAAVSEARAMVLERTTQVAVLQAQRGVTRANIEAARRRLEQAASAVETTAERLAEGERQLAVARRLEQQGAGSRDEVERRQSERDVLARQKRVAEAAVNAATAAVAQDEAELAVLAERTKAAGAAVTAAEAAVARAEALRADADILAPFSGVVLRKEAEVGEMVAPVNAAGSSTRGAIVTLADFATLEMEVDVIERDIGRVAQDLPCRIVLDSRREQPYAGRVRQVVPTADRSRGTVQVKVRFEALDAHVLPEMSGRVEFLDENAADAVLAEDRVLLPARALTTRAGADGVFVLDGETISFRAVTVASRDPDGGGFLLVADGLAGGEQVVVDPAPDLADAATVRVAAAGD